MPDLVNEKIIEAIKKTYSERLNMAKDEEEVKAIQEVFQEQDFTDTLFSIYNTLANDTTIRMQNIMYKEVLKYRAQTLEFLAIQDQQWNKAFVTSEYLYITATEAAKRYLTLVDELPEENKKEKEFRFMALLHLQARSLQQFIEIITLMKNGFADGAYARWRSMYELAVTASFISKYGEKVAKAFINASDTDDRYEWARTSKIFEKKKKFITFNDIQKNCDFDSEIWKYQYELANRVIHASPQGTFFRMGQVQDSNTISVGRSDYGITTPAEHSAISLVQITNLYFSLHPFGETTVAMSYLKNWIDVIREQYFKTHDAIFTEDEKLWSEDMVSFEQQSNSDDE